MACHASPPRTLPASSHGRIEGGAGRLDLLVGNLLDMSRLQTGTVTPIIRESDLDEVVPMALDGVPEDSVELDIPETLPMVNVDPGLLERAVANVVENPVKYSPPGEKVLVSASVIANRVEVRVVDRGPGVPDEAKDRVFEPFQRYGDSPRGAGVGLCLAVARGFTQAVGGTLHAEDTPGAASPWPVVCRFHTRAAVENPERVPSKLSGMRVSAPASGGGAVSPRRHRRRGRCRTAGARRRHTQCRNQRA